MQGGVTGGICLLAFLLSMWEIQGFGDLKQQEEADVSAIKGPDASIEDDSRRSNDLKKSKEVLDDLNKSNVTVGTKEPNSREEGTKDTEDEANSNNQSSSEFSVQSGSGPAQYKETIIPEIVTETLPSKTDTSQIVGSHSNIDNGVPASQRQSYEVTGGTDQVQVNSGTPLISQGYIGGSVPPPSYTKVKNNEVLLGRLVSSRQSSKELEATDKDSPYYAGMNLLPPLYASHVANSLEKTSKGAQEQSHFSPIFSSDLIHPPAPGFIATSKQASIFDDGSLRSANFDKYSSILPDDIRRDLKTDDIQERNADESQYSETSNSYPYTPPNPDGTSSETGELRSAAPYAPRYPPYQNLAPSSAQAYAEAQALTAGDGLSAKNQGADPYSFGHPPSPIASAQSSAIVIEDAKARVIWPNELIFPNKIPGGENVIQCTRENELYHFWSRTFDCLVCICLNVYGLLEPLCASCSGCRKPSPPEPRPEIPELEASPEPYIPLPILDPNVPFPVPSLEPFTPSASAPSLIVEPAAEKDLPITTPLPIREVSATCSPLPSGQSFTNPLHPCQLCICREVANAFGKTDVRIECQDSPNCVVPPDVTTLPPIPDIPVPVPLPLCDKFPPHVNFPHPIENCKVCKCSLELSSDGLAEQQITCYRDTECVPKKIEPAPETVTPPAPPIPIPVEPYAGPVPEPSIEPKPENYPGPISPPNAVAPEEPIPWPPISTPAPPPIPLLPKKGPLPGPSPHDSCRPYPPSQPFQHPWDDCQICQCTESKAIGMVNVEISCYTKLSCCIESPPEHIISEANSIANGAESEALANALASANGHLSTIKPQNFNAYNPKNIQNEGYAEANALAQSSDSYSPIGAPNQGYAEANALALNSDLSKPGIIQNQGYAESNAVAQSVQNSGGLQNQGLAEANAIVQSSQNNPNYQLSIPYQTAAATGSATTSGQSSAEASALSSLSSYNSGVPQNQGYAEANAIAQNNLNNAPYSGTYQSANAFGNAISSAGQSSAEASAEYNNVPVPFISHPGVSQNQAYDEANAVAQNSLSSPAYPQAGIYQPTKAIGSANSGGTASDESSGEYVPLSATYKPPPLYSQYNPGISQNQAYAEANAQYNKLISTTFKPPALYNPYNVEVPQNNVYAEAVAQYSDLMTNTQKPALYGQYSPEISQNPIYGQPNAQYSGIITSTYKPPSLYNPYNPDIAQNAAMAQANAQFRSLPTSTTRPPALYNPYNQGITQNQAYAAANALYKGRTVTEKPQFFNPYNPRAQDQAYAEANAIAQNSLANPGYYLSGPYQVAKALGSANSGDQSSAVAEALAQSQDFTPYLQPGLGMSGTNPLSNPSSGFMYQPNYYGYPNPQYSPYAGKTDQGYAGQYKSSPIKYAGNYEFNGQPDAINILSPQNSYRPYGSGYSQGVPTSNLYSSPYPKQSNYDIAPFRPGQYGGSSGKSAAQAFAETKSRSGEGYQEDLDDSK